MTSEKPRTAVRVAVGTVFTMVALALSVVGPAEPASAHSLSQAVEYGCGSSYRILGSWAMTGASGSKVGDLILAKVPNTQRFCAVTDKLASHGSNTRTYVCIQHNRDLLWKCDDGSYSHFANVTAWNGENKCIRFRGRFKTTNGVWASNEVRKSFANGASCA